MNYNYTLTQSEKLELLNKCGKQPYKMKPHSWRQMRSIGKHVCKGCGLVALNNHISQWCVKKGCNYEDHKQYKQTLKRLTKMEF